MTLYQLQLHDGSPTAAGETSIGGPLPAIDDVLVIGEGAKAPRYRVLERLHFCSLHDLARHRYAVRCVVVVEAVK